MSSVYVAGPMSGKEDYNYAAFHAAEEQLCDEGYEVRNPARNFGGDTSLPYATYIEQAIRDVLASDWIFCLPGWRQSVGARTEVHVAATLGKPVYERVGVGGKRRVKVDRFGTPSAGLPEALTPEQARRIAEAFLPQPIRLFPDASPPTIAPPEVEEVFRQATALLPPAGIDPRTWDTLSAATIAKATERLVTDYQGKVDGGGYKGSMDDPRKLPLHLIPPALLTATAEVLGYGAQKYAPGNWMRGMSWTVVYASLQRHLLAWFSGEDTDPESGLSHIAHASCCVAFLLHFISVGQYHAYDDRVFKVSPAQAPSGAGNVSGLL